VEKGKLNGKIIVIVALLSFFCVFLGQFIYNKYYLLNPLEKQLQSLPQVQQVIIEKTEESVVKVSLTKVSNLASSYQKIEKIVKKKIGKKAKIEIRGQPNDNLKEIERQMSFSLQEAALLGNYAHMDKKLQEIAQKNKLSKWKVYLDQENIYIQLFDGNNYLYEVVPRRGEKNVERS